MKREKIYSILKKKKRICLYDRTYIDQEGTETKSEQYLGDGCAAYLLENLPIFNEETICGLVGADRTEVSCEELDIPDKIADIVYKEMYNLDAVRIEHTGDIFDYAVFTNKQCGICVLADSKYIAPLMNEENDGNYYLYKDFITFCDGFKKKAFISILAPSYAALRKEAELVEMVYDLFNKLRESNDIP